MQPNINLNVSDARSAGFLAYLSNNVEAEGITYIPFDTKVYDDGDNFNNVTGVYTVCQHSYSLYLWPKCNHLESLTP